MGEPSTTIMRLCIKKHNYTKLLNKEGDHIKKATKKDIEFIVKFYHKIKAKDIAENLGLTLHQVYEVARRNNLQQKQNQIVNITKEMHQILISGLLGDGRFKRNGLKNYYYSECHALNQKQYLEWKFNHLGKLTSFSKGLYLKNSHNDSGLAYEFTTLTTPSLKPYHEMNRAEAISQLNDLGLLLYILDDGWTLKYKSGDAVRIALGVLTQQEILLLQQRFKEVLNITPTLIGIKRIDMAFKAKEDIVFKKIISKYNMEDIDVVKYKFV